MVAYRQPFAKGLHAVLSTLQLAHSSWWGAASMEISRQCHAMPSWAVSQGHKHSLAGSRCRDQGLKGVLIP